MADQIIQDLIFRIDANSASLKAGLSQAQGQINTFSKGIGQLKSLIAGAFAGAAILGAAKAVFSFAQEIGKARDAMASLSGLVGTDLVNATAKAKAIADTFDIPFEKLLEGARAVSKEFGISIPEALDKIKQGYALTGSEEFLDTLKEYPAQFASAGASADDFFKVATQGINEGVYSDKGVDAVKEFGLRIRELTPATSDALAAIGISGTEIQKEIANGTLTTFEALQKVSQRLSTFSDDSQQVGQVLADVFGGAGEDAGIRFIKLLGDASTSFDDLTSQMTDAQKAEVHLSDATEELNKIFVAGFGGSSTLVNELKADLIDVAVVSLKAIKKGVVDTINYFIELYNNSLLFRGVIQSTILNFKTLWEGAKLLVTTIIDGFKNAGALLKAVFTGNFGAIPGIIKDAYGKAFENGKEFATATVENFRTAAANILSKEPIKLIDDSEATNQGAKAAQAFKAGFQKLAGKSVDDGNTKVTNVKQVGGIQNQSLAPTGTLNPTAQVDTSAMIAQLTEVQALWYGIGDAIEQSIGTIAVSAIEGVGNALGDLMTTGKANFKELVKSILLGVSRIIQSFLLQAIAAQIAAGSSKGLVGLALAAVGIGIVTAMFAKLSVPAYAGGTNNASGG